MFLLVFAIYFNMITVEINIIIIFDNSLIFSIILS